MDPMDAPISDVAIENIVNDTAPEIEGFKHRVDDIFVKVDTVRTCVTNS
jgi:hypothetical protein